MNRGSPRPGGFREVLTVSWPLVVSTGSFTVMMFCDRMFLSWHSAVELQASVPASILSFTLVCGFLALASYSTTFVAQYHGAGDRKGCVRATAQGVIFSLLSWPVMLVLIFAGRYILGLSGHTPEVLRAELTYFTIVMAGGVAGPLGSAVASFFSGRGDTRSVMWSNIFGNGVNVVLDYGLIFGKWGFPEMGIAGAALATVTSGFIAPAFLFLKLLAARKTFGPIWPHFRFDRQLFVRMLRFGLPSGWHLFVDISAFTAFVLFTGSMGELSHAASNIVLSINTLSFMPFIGIGLGASVLVGQYQGRNQPDLSARAARNAVLIGVTYAVMVGAAYILLPTFFTSMFTDRGEGTLSLEQILPLTRPLLVVVALMGFADAINLILSNALKGAGDTRFVMNYSLILAWGMLFLGEVLLIFVFHQSVVIAWGWCALYVCGLALGFLLRFLSGRWKTIDLLGHEPVITPTRPGAEALGRAD